MDKAALRPLVFDVLRKTPQTHLHAIENELRRKSDEIDRGDALSIHEIVWELLVQGVLAPGKNSLNLTLPFVHVTEYGTRCLEEGGILAHDPTGYIARFIERVNAQASVTMVETVREAVLCFEGGRYDASVVLLARAVECLLSDAADALTISNEGEPLKLLGNLLSTLESRAVSRELRENLDLTFSALRALILRTQTHERKPRMPGVDRPIALGYLLLFPDQCGAVYDWVRDAGGPPREGKAGVRK